MKKKARVVMLTMAGYTSKAIDCETSMRLKGKAAAMASAIGIWAQVRAQRN